MKAETTFDYEDLAHVRRIFSILYTQLILQSASLSEEGWDDLADLEDRILEMIRERACH